MRTFEIAAELVRCGVDVGRISQLLYENFPRRRIELLRELLGTMRFRVRRKTGVVQFEPGAAALALGVLPERQRRVDRPFAGHSRRRSWQFSSKN